MRDFDDDFDCENSGGDGINISPLIDVIFILLIFFMVAMSFADKSAFEVDVPSASNVADIPSGTAVVEISASGEVSVGGRRCPLSAVESGIRRLRARKVVVYADKSSRAEILVAVADAAKSAGVESVFLAASKK